MNKNRDKIRRNIARCRLCDDVIESKFTHDFVKCKCGAIFLDGGKSYIRCGGYPDEIELRTEWEHPDDDELEAA
jgi:hypothetical protein